MATRVLAVDDDSAAVIILSARGEKEERPAGLDGVELSFTHPRTGYCIVGEAA